MRFDTLNQLLSGPGRKRELSLSLFSGLTMFSGEAIKREKRGKVATERLTPLGGSMPVDVLSKLGAWLEMPPKTCTACKGLERLTLTQPVLAATGRRGWIGWLWLAG